MQPAHCLSCWYLCLSFLSHIWRITSISHVWPITLVDSSLPFKKQNCASIQYASCFHVAPVETRSCFFPRLFWLFARWYVCTIVPVFYHFPILCIPWMQQSDKLALLRWKRKTFIKRLPLYCICIPNCERESLDFCFTISVPQDLLLTLLLSLSPPLTLSLCLCLTVRVMCLWFA